MNILFVAYGYNPQGRSESLTAYNVTHAVQRFGHEIAVLTRSRTPGPHITNIPCSRLFPRSRYFRGMKLEYMEFIYKAYRAAQRRTERVDVIHHVSPISFRYPDPLCNLGPPFVWGPLGGSLDYPPGFGYVAVQDSLVQKLRVLDRLRLRVDPLIRNTMRRAAAIVVTTNAARALLPEKYRARTVVIPEGIAAETIVQTAPECDDYIFASGRLVPYKSIDLALRAYARSGIAGEVRLLITGGGPEMERLQRLIGELGLEGRARLLGQVPKPENLELMRRAEFCVFPALNESFGHVNLEAMAARKAVIVTDWGGPADIVRDGETGFKILAPNADDYVELLAQRMARLHADKDLRRTMEENALRRVAEVYTWDVIGRRYDELYRSVCTA